MKGARIWDRQSASRCVFGDATFRTAQKSEEESGGLGNALVDRERRENIGSGGARRVPLIAHQTPKSLEKIV